jgi:hypothetical protein
MGVEEETGMKGRDNLLTNINSKLSPFLRKGGTTRYRRISEYQTGRIRKEIHPDIL